MKTKRKEIIAAPIATFAAVLAHTVLIVSPTMSGSAGLVVGWGDGGAAATRIPAGLTNVIAIASGGIDHPADFQWSGSAALLYDSTIVYWAYDLTGGMPGFTNFYANSSALAVAAGGSSLFEL